MPPLRIFSGATTGKHWTLMIRHHFYFLQFVLAAQHDLFTCMVIYMNDSSEVVVVIIFHSYCIFMGNARSNLVNSALNSDDWLWRRWDRNFSLFFRLFMKWLVFRNSTLMGSSCLITWYLHNWRWVYNDDWLKDYVSDQNNFLYYR